jgi:hypothetical protein
MSGLEVMPLFNNIKKSDLDFEKYGENLAKKRF